MEFRVDPVEASLRATLKSVAKFQADHLGHPEFLEMILLRLFLSCPSSPNGCPQVVVPRPRRVKVCRRGVRTVSLQRWVLPCRFVRRRRVGRTCLRARRRAVGLRLRRLAYRYAGKSDSSGRSAVSAEPESPPTVPHRKTVAVAVLCQVPSAKTPTAPEIVRLSVMVPKVLMPQVLWGSF